MTLMQIFTVPMGGWRKRKPELSRRAAKPRIGATIVCADLRMTVQPGLSTELWRWLAVRGWRELDSLDSRHKLRALPTTAVMELFDAPESEWDHLLLEAMRQAIRKPTLKARQFA
jgi:hypothetical protein